MIPRYIGEQIIVSKETWSEVVEVISDYWDGGFLITDFDYGDGHYIVVLSKVVGWTRQCILYGSEFPEYKVDDAWENGLYITNVLHDGCDWIVIMTSMSDCVGQRWITHTDWNSFKRRVDSAMDDGMIVTKIACSQNYPTTYCAVASVMDYSQAQRLRFYPGMPTPDMIDLCTRDTVLIDMNDVDGGIVALTASDTGWDDQKLLAGNWRRVIEYIEEGWEHGYRVTTLCYSAGYWVVAMSY